MCEQDPEMARKSQLIFDAADKLDENGWHGPAQDLRESIPPGEVIRRVEDVVGVVDDSATPEEQAELDRAVPILIDLERALDE